MTGDLPRIRADSDSSGLIALLRDCGGAVVEDLLDRNTVGAINAELDPFVDAADPNREFLNPAVDWFFGNKTRHVSAVTSKSPTFARDVLCHPLLLEIADAILGPSCSSYQLNIAHLLDRGPGAEAQMLHRDELVWIHVPRPHPELQFAMMIALEDFTADNGATQLVPGSHRWPLAKEAEPGDITAAEMSAGSAVLYLGSTLHGGGANTSPNRNRRGLHLSYVVGWLRTEENNILSTPPEIARTLPLKAQQLVGYQAHDAISEGGGYLGTVDLRDPTDLIAEGKL